MRPLRLLVSLSSSLIAITLLLYISLSARHGQTPSEGSRKSRGGLRAFFSFTSPSSLFPPSAIISLTDDNSTFFLARPAAFGPGLPSKGLSGQLWIGSGFSDSSLNDPMTSGSEGELGCSDVPGWSDERGKGPVSPGLKLDTQRKAVKASQASSGETGSKSSRSKRGTIEKEDIDPKDTKAASSKADDGTDDYLHHPLADSEISKTGPEGSVANGAKTPEHADIQSLQESAEIAGKVVLLSRGGCGFLEKVKWAQRRGAIALIVGDDVRGGPLVTMYARGDTSNITIPAIFTSHTTAHLLSSLIPSGGLIGNLDLGGSKTSTEKGSKDSASGKKLPGGRPQSSKTYNLPSTTPDQIKGKAPGATAISTGTSSVGWFRSFFSIFGLCSSGKSTAASDTRRPPSSGNIDWVQEDWDAENDLKLRPGGKSDQKSLKKTGPTSSKTSGDDFIIGVQDWRDPDLLPQQTSSSKKPDSDGKKHDQSSEGTQLNGGSITPGSGVYENPSNSHVDQKKLKSSSSKDSSKDGSIKNNEEKDGWFSHLLGGENEDEPQPSPSLRPQSDSGSEDSKLRTGSSNSKEKVPTDNSDRREGLWVTLTPTSMSSSPFIDTLLVLVVSPLVTLTVVYALLLFRARLRRRRWRAPKSLVERLPVRTYHTLSNDTTTSNSPLATPINATPTTPLLHSPSRSSLRISRPRSRTASDIPAQSSSFRSNRQRSVSPEQEKREAGLAEWRRRYGGRQKECVVCLEEYVDGISRVMSLPCGHEFHAECITPWLTTRRRTCPICKGDVVRSMARHSCSSSSSSDQRRERGMHLAPHQDDLEDVQDEAMESRNDSPEAALPISIDEVDEDEPDPDLERAHLSDNNESRNSSRERDSGGGFWRGFGSWLGGEERRVRSIVPSPDRDR